MDPALYGLIGTGVGGLIGFVGTWFSTRTTARATAEREERARLFTEKKKSYASAADVLSACKDEMAKINLFGEFVGFDKKYRAVATRYYGAYYDLLIIGGDSIIEDTLRKVNHYWVEISRAGSKIEELWNLPKKLQAKDHDDRLHNNIDIWIDGRRELDLAMGQLVLAMREDLRPTPRSKRARFPSLCRRARAYDDRRRDEEDSGQGQKSG